MGINLTTAPVQGNKWKNLQEKYEQHDAIFG